MRSLTNQYESSRQHGRFTWQLHTAAATPPVTVQEVREHSRIAIFDDDALAYRLIKTATDYIQHREDTQLVTATWDLILDSFQCGAIEIPKWPVPSISSITYLDTSGSTQTWSASAYNLIQGKPCRIVPDYGTVFPVTQCFPGAVTVRMVLGYGAASAVPAAIKQAIYMLVAHWYENRELMGDEKQIPHAVEALLGSASWGSGL